MLTLSSWLRLAPSYNWNSEISSPNFSSSPFLTASEMRSSTGTPTRSFDFLLADIYRLDHARLRGRGGGWDEARLASDAVLKSYVLLSFFSEIELNGATEGSVEVNSYADQPTQGEQASKVNISLHKCFILFYWHIIGLQQIKLAFFSSDLLCCDLIRCSM